MNGELNSDYHWYNKPEYFVESEKLTIKTSPETDFWQRTHYGISKDNGHCLLLDWNKDFSIEVRTNFQPEKQYDQCGLIVRIDENNWIKISTEFEGKTHSRLGSVVTNFGYSDWATVDVNEPVGEMRYRIQSKNNLRDFLLEYSKEGKQWSQLRITHLHKETDVIAVGIYACSPLDSSFEASFSKLRIAEASWP